MAEPSRKRVKTADKSGATTNFFHGMRAVITENGLGKTRAEILGQKFVKHGGFLQNKLDKTITHVFVASTVRYERIPKFLRFTEQQMPEKVTVVKADWISTCLLENKYVNIGEYIVSNPKCDNIVKDEGETSNIRSIVTESVSDMKETTADSTQEDQREISSFIKIKESETQSEVKNTAQTFNKGDEDSDFTDSGNEGDDTKDITNKCSPEKTKGTWICALPSTSRGVNHNQHITDKLQVLATSYANTKDQWRALGYKKAIASIKAYHKPIETWEECSKLPFVGEKLAKKIWEIVETGHLRRLDHMDPKIEAINLFSDVWGTGPQTAELWASQGFRTLEDLEQKAKLTSQQKIGLKYYHEFCQRMPREEAGKIGEEVHVAVKEVNPGLVCETCGSYRRGKLTCGDVDVLVSHPDGRSHKGILPEIISRLKAKGFITDDLVSVGPEQSKYMGVCKLPGNTNKHRRLDIIVKPYCEYACAIMYFTGSDYFNRSMRLLAKKNGMSLTEHSLNTGVVRHGGEKVFEGTPLPVNSEQDIFKYLGLTYRTPEERDW